MTVTLCQKHVPGVCAACCAGVELALLQLLQRPDAVEACKAALTETLR
jgi:hypothetical protein